MCGMMALVRLRRIIPVVALLALGGVLAACEPDGPDPVSPIGWSSPQELPPPQYDNYRSEFVSDEKGSRFYPRSGRVTPSTAYRFDTGHCGLTFLADFDGSFWEPIRPAGGAMPDSFIDQDEGAIALVDFDEAVYRSSDGTEVTLRRLDGPVTTFPCE
jgi:hypothetical protein